MTMTTTEPAVKPAPDTKPSPRPKPKERPKEDDPWTVPAPRVDPPPKAIRIDMKNKIAIETKEEFDAFRHRRRQRMLLTC